MSCRSHPTIRPFKLLPLRKKDDHWLVTSANSVLDALKASLISEPWKANLSLGAEGAQAVLHNSIRVNGMM